MWRTTIRRPLSPRSSACMILIWLIKSYHVHPLLGHLNRFYIQFQITNVKMPSRLSSNKSTPRSSKRKAADKPLSETTPVRHSSRIKKPSNDLLGRPSKRARKLHGDSEISNEDGNSSLDSDFEVNSTHSEPTEETSEVEDEEVQQSYSIPLPKARDAGDTPYESSQIHPNTFLFLRDLKANNNREWLKC